MRYSTLIFTALFALLTTLGPETAFAQTADKQVKIQPPAVQILPVDNVVAKYLERSDRDLGDTARSYVMGRVTDFGGRSVRGAEVTLFSLDSDEIKRATTNAFGYYRFPNLAEGESYLIAVAHRRYLFLTGSISFTVETTPIQIDFQAEEMP